VFPVDTTPPSVAQSEKTAAATEQVSAPKAVASPAAEAPATGKKQAAAKQPKTAAAAKKTEPDVPDVARLDMRVGRITKAWKHPSADSLYVEEIDVGEPKPRTVCSGLVGKIPLETLEGTLVVCLCNLKPAKMRGISSEAMVLAATAPDTGVVELVNPPADTAPGTVVTVQGITPKPDAQLNPKKNPWDNVQPLLKTNADGVACFDGTPLVTPTGPLRVKSVKNASIK